MRKLLLIVGLLCLCASQAVAKETVSSGWACAKAAISNSIQVGDQPGHTYSIDQVTCTSTYGEMAGSRFKVGTGTEFAEITHNGSQGHGVFVATMANGDKVYFNYQTVRRMQSLSNKYQATSGTGKFSGIKSSGGCTGTAKANGSSLCPVAGLTQSQSKSGYQKRHISNGMRSAIGE